MIRGGAWAVRRQASGVRGRCAVAVDAEQADVLACIGWARTAIRRCSSAVSWANRAVIDARDAGDGGAD